MVKPQSSKLITRVRFPSSPRDLGSRRFRVEALSFSLEGMTGIPSACGFVSSRARNPHAPARHPLHKSRSRLPGIAYGRKCIPSRARDFRPPARHPLENYPERIVRTASACRLVSSRARSPREDSRGLLAFLFSTADFSEPAFPTPGSRGTSRACVRRFLPCGWWCRIAGTPRPGACTRSSRARARPQFREYRGGPRARW